MTELVLFLYVPFKLILILISCTIDIENSSVKWKDLEKG